MKGCILLGIQLFSVRERVLCAVTVQDVNPIIRSPCGHYPVSLMEFAICARTFTRSCS